MKKIEEIIFGMGKPDAWLETRIGVRAWNEVKKYGDVEVALNDGKLELFSTEYVIRGNSNVRKALIFLSDYTKAFNFQYARLALEGFLQRVSLEHVKISPDFMWINGSAIYCWPCLTPIELGSAIEIAKRREVIIRGDYRPWRMLYYTGEKDGLFGKKIYIENKKKYVLAHGIFMPEDYDYREVNGYKLFEFDEKALFLGRNAGALIENPTDRVINGAIAEIKKNPGWILKNHSPHMTVLERRAGPFKIEKKPMIYGTIYNVIAADGTSVYSTNKKSIGEKLSFNNLVKYVY